MRLIDADALLKKQTTIRVTYHCQGADEWDDYEAVLVKDINNAPTISPDEVRGVGKWEQKEIFGVEETTIEQMQSACCSVCGKYHTTPYSYYFSKYNYCPSCGARMSRAEAEKAMEVRG